ncbi:lamin tail domain-containing protein [Pseudobythopirellula maris]|nr:lamin tail domain-containing protein [Pseudobythopirellula maris]
MIGWLREHAAWMDEQMAPVPSLSPPNGDAGTEVTLSVDRPGATIYYTLDGSDPRAADGGYSPTALVYSDPFLVGENVTVNARAVEPGSDFPWSAMATGQYATIVVPADAGNLRVTEINYHPDDPTQEELALVPGADDNSFEFFELLNTSNQTVDLTGVRFTDGIEFDFSTGAVGVLAPGEAVVVVENHLAFNARYGAGRNVAGEYSGRLSNSGEEIAIVGADDSVILSFEYDDSNSWPDDADGDGAALQVIDYFANPADPNNWRESDLTGGTPGAATLLIDGDYDRDGVVTRDDYDAWIQRFGETVDGPGAVPGAGADGNRNGVADAADFTVWRDHLGDVAPPLDYQPPPAVAAVAAATAPASAAVERSADPVSVAHYTSVAHTASNAVSEAAIEDVISAAPTASSNELLLLGDQPNRRLDGGDEKEHGPTRSSRTAWPQEGLEENRPDSTLAEEWDEAFASL